MIRRLFSTVHRPRPLVATGLAFAIGAGPSAPSMAHTDAPASAASSTKPRTVSKDGPNDAAEIARIARTLDLLHASAAKADGATYFGLFAPDAVFIGSDVSERWPIETFKAYAAPIFATGRGWVYSVRHREVRIAPVACHCVAWFDEVLDSEKYGTSRGTGVLVRDASGWKIEQYALTFPMPNDLAAEFTQRIRDHEKNARR